MQSLSGLDYIHALAQWRGSRDFDLTKISAVMAELGNPQNTPRSVHVTGTNGKGSVSAAIASVLASTGVTVGLNISPHLSSLNERFIVNGIPASDAMISDAAIRVKAAAERTGVSLSFHEGITAAAFVCFEDLDWIVMEVGLGGRLDASNVLERPEVAAIVTVDFDHEHILGSTLAEIAREKAGIVKRGSQVVAGPLSQEALREVEAACNGAAVPLFAFNRDFTSSPCGNLTYCYSSNNCGSVHFQPSLPGKHQAVNMAVVVQMAKLLQVDDAAIEEGIRGVFWPARLERLEIGNRTLLLDCAHNPAGIRVLVDYLAEAGLRGCEIGFAALQTKNWREMVEILLPHVSDWTLLRADSHLAIDPEEIAAFLGTHGIPCAKYGMDYGAFVEHKVTRGEGPLLIAGSMYMVGGVRRLLVSGQQPLWKARTLSHAGMRQ